MDIKVNDRDISKVITFCSYCDDDNGVTFVNTEKSIIGRCKKCKCELISFIPATVEPRIVVLCGSTTFIDLFDKMSLEYTLKGWIVLSIGSHKFCDKNLKEVADKKEMLGELHFRKIDKADLVYVINKDGYIGDSTRSEIEYAIEHDKNIEYMEEPKNV